ncbi:hypothetical protein FPOA_11371 [Fusarium poae]|uniref:Uncharacterized protein n=1 Tax=Fusarium poae TaxID=36050 RepID=A0A1B8AGV2_FUSPO|nr:hypothetical protein FPOA_11371 [Fusarium poae]
MRLSITVLVAIQASMGLAHAIPFSPSEYSKEGGKRETFRDLFKKYGIDSSIGPETDKHESKEHHGDFKYRLKHYYPHDHESHHEYSDEEKYEPKEGHTITKVKVKKYYPHEHHEDEDDYDYKDKYNNLGDDHGYNSDKSEKHHYPHEHHEDEDHYDYKKDYDHKKDHYDQNKDHEAKEIDAFNDHYGLSEQDFDKYFTKDHHDHSEKYEPEESPDSDGSKYKRWPPEDPIGSPFPGSEPPPKLQWHDPNEEHTHSYKYKEKPKYPDPPPEVERYNPKDIYESSKDKLHDEAILNPGYHSPEKYEAEIEDDKLSHFKKYEQENDNLPYFDKFPGKYLPKHPFDEDEAKETVPKSEYEGEDDPYHPIDGVDQFHSKEIYKKPDYDKEDRDKYHDDDDDEEGEHPKHDPSPKDADEYGMKGVYGFKYEYHPEEKSFLSEEAFETHKHGNSDQSESVSYKKYLPKEEKKEKKYPNEAEKYGYKKYDPKEDDEKDNHSDEKSHHAEEKDEKDKYSDEDMEQVSKQLYYPSHHEPTESAKFYRKHEVDHNDHKSNKKPKPQKKGEHRGYYKEPGYENVVPGFMWAGPGAVTKTPCPKREGCPHGHWHMLEPKNGEHRRIGITGTNIVVEPDYTRPDYKEDTVNHVLPGYENVIPGFEWAGIGVVTEVPCRSAADCPEGGWFMLAPKLGEHRRIAMNYPKAPTTHHHHPASEPTVHMHKSDYKARSPVGHEGLVYEKDHEDDVNEREYKLINRHSRGLDKRSIEARAPCKKKPPKEEKPKEVKKIDPNKPLPRLSTVHLLNIEKLSEWKREALVAAMPMMDDEFKMEFLTFQELTPEFIAKLNELYAILLETADGRRIIEFITRRPKYVPSSKRSVRELSEKEIKRIEELSPVIRQIVAKKLDFDPKLTQELADAEELSDDLIKKLNKEYARVMSDPKYAKIVKSFLSKSKRAEPKLTKEMISKTEELSPATRMMAGKKLDFDPKLTLELANAGKFSDDLIEKLNKEWARIASDPKYLKIIERFVSKPKSKRAEPELSKEMISKVESMSPSMRMMAAKKLDMDPELTTEMANTDKFTPELIEKLNKEYARISKDPKYKSLLDKIGFKHKRADEAPELSEIQLKKLEELSPEIRVKAAKRLRMDEKLSAELINTKKFTPELIEKLKKHYVLRYKQYKEKKVIVSKSKRQHNPRFPLKFTDQQLDKITNMSESERRFIAEKLNFKKDFADEFIKSEKFTPHLVKKLNEVYNQIYGGHKYNELVEHFSTNFKRQASSDPKGKEDESKLDPEELENLANKIREKITKELELDMDLDSEFLYAKKVTESFIEKLTDLARDVVVNLKWEEIVEEILDEDDASEKKENSDAQKVKANIENSPSTNSTKTTEIQSVNAQNSTSLPESQLESDQQVTKISEEQPASNKNVEKRDLDEKLEKSKKNGWCDEFLGTLKDTWDESVDEALTKTEEEEKD